MGLYIIDLLRLSDTKAALLKNFRMQPSEVDKMVYWEYELLLESLNKMVNEENERQQKEMDKYHVNEHMDSIRSGKMMKTPDMNFKTPDFGSMKVPKF